ncbi:MAG: ferrous iron transport protein B [Deltaproteobacteria bacterium CG_4_10_14_0_2_um_filter_43_8]|nr:MAG: ferrous iron transport protein B [Deltaproteobacteria bacterium CG11_big_fil_rev_8_21_14_0_20_42_23]PJA21188.1 MAG: ferrous iron transport protein B [Deltaproteobacteria bacterium CG_4_10_14_0_2_um_filter_43_8]PJC64798.1 MAG: ferrous iron transport protein B [Deltaproteobacteria bacterium CG_4_9_14_0_2_um_filter_42_21]
MKTYLLIGNPNTGKTTLFNALSGSRQKVGNYPGVTVEKKEGHFEFQGEKIKLIDLPGTYSLIANSPDEEITTEILLGRRKLDTPIDGVVIVADATNLTRSLFFTTQVIDCELPTLLVLNMYDEVEKKKICIDVEKLSNNLGVPIVTAVAPKKKGVEEIKHLLAQGLKQTRSILPQLKLPAEVQKEFSILSELLKKDDVQNNTDAEALRLLTREGELSEYKDEPLRKAVLASQQNLEAAGIDWRALESEYRYTWIENVLNASQCTDECCNPSFASKLDRVIMHKIIGPIFFFVLMALLFQALFTWSSFPMDLIDGFFGWLGNVVAAILPDGSLKSLIVDGVIAGIGSVVIFVPQIAFLFFFLTLMEDSGYMARAAFVMDRIMFKLGLHGKAFIPLLSSFACAIPGVMATRTIENKRDRIATMMIAPLMSCSARLPVYALLIAACIPSITYLGVFNLQGLILWGLYILGVIAAIIVAFVLKKTMLKTISLPFLMEMPPYRMPKMTSVLRRTWERAKVFLTNAGTVIFAFSIILWFVTSYPKPNTISAGENTEVKNISMQTETEQSPIEYSFAGRLGKAIEPALKPLGFDWKIGIGLIASFAAREIFVSTMAIVYRVGDDVDETSPSLLEAVKNQKRENGKPVFTPLVGLGLLVFFLFACQCMSTVAIVKRETNSWRWPIFMFSYMTALAYVAALAIYQVGTLLGC